MTQPTRFSLLFRWPMKAVRRGLLSALMLGGMTLISACVENGASQMPGGPGASSSLANDAPLPPPVVISSKPARDLIAFEQSERELSSADWAILERLGPRPMWEKLSLRKPQLPAARATTPGAMGPVRVGKAGASAVGTEMSTPIDESDLPVQVIEMPDGKIRMIWVLRSYGGTTVASTRDAGTSRRAVAASAPDLAPLVAVITPSLGQGGTVMPLPKENTLVITCGKEMRTSLLDLLARLDVPAKQVEITAKIFEVSRDFDFQQGTELVLNRLAADSSQTLISRFSARRFIDSLAGGASAATPVQGSVLSLMKTFADAGIAVDISFQLLAEAGLIQVVSSPRMTVAVGQTGYMLAGQELPIQSANFVNNVLQTATSYKPVGVQLYITPQAAGAERIKLHTISIVSSVSGFAPLPTMDGQNSPKQLLNPIIDSREAETQVTISYGDTLVISGLRMSRITTRENKIPGLGDLPALGWLFKNHRAQQQMTDLYFFVTPELL